MQQSYAGRRDPPSFPVVRTPFVLLRRLMLLGSIFLPMLALYHIYATLKIDTS